MGDRTFVSFNVNGRIETVEALTDLIDALESYYAYPSSGGNDNFGAIAEAIARGAPYVGFCAEEVNYGDFTDVESVCQAHGIAYDFEWESGCDYAAGTAGWSPETGRSEASTDGNQPTVGLDELSAALTKVDPFLAVRAIIDRLQVAAGIGIGKLSASDAVKAHLTGDQAGDVAPEVAESAP